MLRMATPFWGKSEIPQWNCSVFHVHFKDLIAPPCSLTSLTHSVFVIWCTKSFFSFLVYKKRGTRFIVCGPENQSDELRRTAELIVSVCHCQGQLSHHLIHCSRRIQEFCSVTAVKALVKGSLWRSQWNQSHLLPLEWQWNYLVAIYNNMNQSEDVHVNPISFSHE